ncbi:MAG: hypothetical protein ABSF03_15645 [Streptosporangiaceae bacterium]|jgi:hypothetical protein
MTDADWLAQLPVIGNLPPDLAAAKLREVGEDEIAQALADAPELAPATYGVLSRFGIGRDRAWQHTAHAIGYLAPVDGPQTSLLEIQQAGNIASDEALKGSRIKLTLDGLRVADYPGRGMHRVLFDFAARNQTGKGAEQLHFHTTYPVREGEQAAAQGRPIFVGLQVGADGLFLQCATLNVLNQGDEALLRFLDGDAFKGGLQLLTTAQPVLAPFVALTLGLTETIAARNRNVTVQAVDMGLDFSRIPLRPKLAEGSYIAVQIPETLQSVWSWEDWRYDPITGHVVNTLERDLLIPYNYFVVSVSRYQGP